MKTDKKPIIGLICVMLSCILVIGLTLGLLISANKNGVAAGSTADTTTDTTDATEEPPAEDPVLKPELEWGFSKNYDDGCIDSLSGCIAYRSDKNTFDVEDVKLTIYYGDVFGSIEYERETRDIPVFNISCVNFHGDPYLIREVNENIISEEYRITRVRDENYRVTEIIFNHSEEIVIPKEVFQGEKGRITLFIWGINVKSSKHIDPDTVMVDTVIATTNIYYKMIEPSKVMLLPANNIYR